MGRLIVSAVMTFYFLCEDFPSTWNGLITPLSQPNHFVAVNAHGVNEPARPPDRRNLRRRRERNQHKSDDLCKLRCLRSLSLGHCLESGEQAPICGSSIEQANRLTEDITCTMAILVHLPPSTHGRPHAVRWSESGNSSRPAHGSTSDRQRTK